MDYYQTNTPPDTQAPNTLMDAPVKPIPGQTAPRLIATLKQADIRSRDPTERNPFTEPPRGYDESLDDVRKNQRVLGSCKHYWTTQTNQSVLPNSERGLSDAAYRISCFCQQCRWHFDIVITLFHHSCPSQSSALHHFVDFRKLDQVQEWYSARCSSCAATLEISYRAPTLLAEDVALLTDTGRLRQRFVVAKAKDPDRIELKAAPPLEVLDALACYVRDALKPSDTHRAIPRLNRRFLLSFGEDCTPLLEKLGFVQTEETWQLPQPPPEDPWQWGLRKQLQDVEEEIWALMRSQMQAPNQDLRKLKAYREKPETFDNDIQVLFSTIEYDKSRIVRRTPLLSQEEERWHAGLGSLGDFSDELLEFAFDKQLLHDPVGASYYYDCLSKLAKKKNSENLEIKVATLASEGYFGRDDVAKAYRYFALDPWQATAYSDDYIRGTFESRLSSVQSWQEPEMREMLRIIALSRGSDELKAAAANDLQTYEQAVKWLEPTYDGSVVYGDDMIVTLAVSKKADPGTDASMVHKAVEIIARHRNSDGLHSWLIDGNVPTSFPDDELAAAYTYYDIKDRSGSIDKDVLHTMLALKELETDSAEALKHYNVLLRHTNGETASEQADFESPVGLQNMGNTCYLNSLLQYFYSIKPFREMVMNFDQYKQPLDDNTPDSLGRVGGEEVNHAQVKAAQEFMAELAILFHQMATAPGPVVKPEWKLACLALQQSPEHAQGLARRSTIVSTPSTDLTHAAKPEDSESKSTEPKESEPSKAAELDINRSPTPDSMTGSGDGSSDVTLVGDTILTPDSDTDEIQKVDTIEVEASAESTAQPSEMPDTDDEPTESMDVQEGNPPQPSRPPPVPPRPKLTINIGADSWKKEAEAAANQHDVQEVVGNVIHQARCAIKPASIAAEGDRSDLIKNLFYTTSIRSFINKKLEDATVVENTIVIPLAEQPRNIREALDLYFGLHTVDDGGKYYFTVTQPAPFIPIYFQNQKSMSREVIIKGETKPEYYTELIKHHVQLDETINMDRYMSNSSPELFAMRQESWGLRERRNQLYRSREKLINTKVTGLDGPDALEATWQFINELGDELDDTSTVQEHLHAEIKLRRRELEEINNQIEVIDGKLKAMPLDKFDTPENEYRLFAVFVHRGGTRGGHYWIYIRDFAHDVWRCYNDGTVREVKDTSEIFEKQEKSFTHEAPNFVVYVQNNKKDDLVDALYRVRPESTEPADVEMSDAQPLESGRSPISEGSASMDISPITNSDPGFSDEARDFVLGTTDDEVAIKEVNDGIEAFCDILATTIHNSSGQHGDMHNSVIYDDCKSYPKVYDDEGIIDVEHARNLFEGLPRPIRRGRGMQSIVGSYEHVREFEGWALAAEKAAEMMKQSEALWKEKEKKNKEDVERTQLTNYTEIIKFDRKENKNA